MLVGLFTGLSDVGGVQQMGRHVGAVLVQMAIDRGEPCSLLSLNDHRGLHSFTVGDREYIFRGFGRNKLRFVCHVLGLASRIRVAYLGHVHLAPLGLLLRLINQQLQYWITAHGVEVWFPLSPLRRLALRNARGVVAVSTYTAEQMAKAQGLKSDKLFIVPPAVDPGFARGAIQNNSLPFPPQSRVILTVGRLVSSEPGKGVDTVIRALPKVLRVVPDSFYVVVGDGDYRPNLEKLAEEFDVGDRVRFVVDAKADDLKRYYARSDVFVMPSRQEGFGLVFLEAMNFGKPVIAGSHGGTPEFVKDGITGFSVEYDNVDLLAERLIRLLQDKRLSAQMGEVGRKWVENNHTFEHFRQRLFRVLGERVN